jgi:ATP-dependent DNA helicase RecG
MNFGDIQRLAAGGETEQIEFKKSTAQLSRAGETLCGFLNGRGGRVLIGVTPDGKIVGQRVSDKTQQEVAALLQRFEPPAPVEIQHIDLPKTDQSLVVLDAPAAADS